MTDDLMILLHLNLIEVNDEISEVINDEMTLPHLHLVEANQLNEAILLHL